jgi:hypothetical protein
MADYDYTKHYELEKAGKILPVVFITKNDAISYAKEMNLGACILHKRSEFGKDFSLPIVAYAIPYAEPINL